MPQPRRPLAPTLDAPTLAVAFAVYGGWLAATVWHDRLPLWLLPVVGGWLTAWQGSLQHETIHCRPTGLAWLDAMIGGWPLSLWLPYGRYRESHLAHHRTPHVTHPGHDPETRYLSAGAGAASRLAMRVQATLPGRLLAGPPIEVARFLAGEARALARGERAAWRAWAWHAAGVAAVLAWLNLCGFGLGLYVLTFVLPGAALTLLRSFAEHRADPDPRRRAAVVERAPVLGLLFLNNNLHAVHHARPDLAWWRLPGAYARTRGAVLEANGGLVYRGYGEVLRRFLARANDAVVHPGPAPEAAP